MRVAGSGWAAAGALALLCSSCAREEPRLNVLLVTVDTLRADRLSCAGYPRATTPSLDRLAAEGLRFTHAQSPRAKTTPAIATLLSGLYPQEHSVRDLAAPVPRTVPLLQERFRAAGWSTGAIVGNWVLGDERSGLARGFDLWVESLPDVRGVPPHDAPQRTARSLTDAALVALGLEPAPEDAAFQPRAAFVAAERPWFLWLHYMDPHGAYDPPAEHRVFRREAPDPVDVPAEDEPRQRSSPHAPRVALYNVPAEARLQDGRVDAAAVRDLYDGEVRYADAEIGRLIERLRAARLLETTIVVVTADHGESLGEHLYWFEHGLNAYEDTCRVPLIVRLPERLRKRPAPGVRRGDVSLADLAPTLCALARVDPPGAAGQESRSPRGASRAELLLSGDSRGEADGHAVFCEKVERAEQGGVVQHKAVRMGDWKLIQRFAHRADQAQGGPARELALLGEELYDLGVDPREERNLAPTPPPDAPLARLRAHLRAFTLSDLEFPELDRVLARRREALERGDRDALRILEALGY